MRKILTTFLLFIFSVPAFAATYHGTVIDADDGEPVIAYACIKGTQSCAETDYTTGAFQIVVDTETRKNPQIEITAVGYKSQDINVTSVNNFGNILLHREHEEIEEAVHTETVVGTYCNSNVQNSLPTGHYVKQLNSDEVICKPDECLYNTYIVQQQSDGTFKCVLDPNIKDRTGSKCTGSELKKLNLEHATAGDVLIWDEFSDEVLSCTVTTCENGFTPNDAGTGCKSTKCPKCGQVWDNNKNQCVSRIGQPCSANNAKTATYQCPDGKDGNEICEIAENGCNDGYRLENNRCISNNGQSCDPGEPGAIGYLHKQGDKLVCQIDACEDGYRLVKGKCEPRQKIDDESMKQLKANAQKMHEQENSLANKTLGAVGMGATGIGGMMVGAALSEQRLDADAERAMRAYLETFRCEYGSGRGAKGGETNIELPGGNDMFNLYAQYATLAGDLKTRKSALGIKPGIESEIVIDKAETGLYDDVGTGITGGAYASVARALQNPDGEDAKLWAAQKQATAENLKTGAITAGVGAAASLVGNIALNSGKSKQNQVNNILSNATFEPLKKLEEQINSLPPQTATCPEGSTGTYPKCKCTQNDHVMNQNSNLCELCTGSRTQQESQDGQYYICGCSHGQYWNPKTEQCQDHQPTCEQSETHDGNKVTYTFNNCQTVSICINGFTLDGTNCVCTTPKTVQEGQCVLVEKTTTQTETVVTTADLNSEALFATGKYALRQDAKETLQEFVTTNFNNINDCQYVIITGYADPQGNDKSNKTLSENRAKTVKDFLEKELSIPSGKISFSGQGENDCVCREGKLNEGCTGKKAGDVADTDMPYAPCRRVNVTMVCPKTSTTTQTVTQ